MSIEERLKEERLRLGFNQTDFAALANRTKKTLIDYEKGTSSPDAKFLAAIAAAGADVQYILTGKESTTEISAEEQELINLYRQDGQVREALKNMIQQKKQTLEQLSNLTANDSNDD